jgi:hypothetical protein
MKSIRSIEYQQNRAHRKARGDQLSNDMMTMSVRRSTASSLPASSAASPINLLA